MIAELEADGQVRREHVEHLKTALLSSRTIGAAIGMIMASRNVSEDEVFTVLRKASQHANQKISMIAADLVASSNRSRDPSD